MLFTSGAWSRQVRDRQAYQLRVSYSRGAEYCHEEGAPVGQRDIRSKGAMVHRCFRSECAVSVLQTNRSKVPVL